MAERRWTVCALASVLCSLGSCTCSSKAPSHDDGHHPAAIVDNMVPVPAGWFSAGCYRLLANVQAPAPGDQLDDTDEKRMEDCVEADPPRRLWISSFEVDRFEVTIGEYQQCVAARVCERPASRELLPGGASEDPEPGLPTIVTFDDATVFCQWRHKRLPTDAEWQKAARGTDDRIYPWGDARPTCKHTSTITWNHDGFNLSCDGFAIRPVGQRRAGASPYGAEDLEDNAAEWVKDWWYPYGPARNAIGPGQIHLHSHVFSRNTTGPDPVLEYDWSTIELRWQNPAIVDPQGPPEYVSKQPEAPRHVAKGGAHNPGISGSAPAQPGDSTHRLYAGFRCVRTIPGPPLPAVQAPTADQFTLPFREPGYTPPGTPATDAKPPPKGTTP